MDDELLGQAGRPSAEDVAQLNRAVATLTAEVGALRGRVAEVATLGRRLEALAQQVARLEAGLEARLDDLEHRLGALEQGKRGRD